MKNDPKERPTIEQLASDPILKSYIIQRENLFNSKEVFIDNFHGFFNRNVQLDCFDCYDNNY